MHVGPLTYSARKHILYKITIVYKPISGQTPPRKESGFVFQGFGKIVLCNCLALFLLLAGALPVSYACSGPCCMETGLDEHSGARRPTTHADCCCNTETAPCNMVADPRFPERDIVETTLYEKLPVRASLILTTAVESAPKNFRRLITVPSNLCEQRNSPSLYIWNASLLC